MQTMKSIILLAGVQSEKYIYIKSKIEIFISTNNIDAHIEENNNIASLLNSNFEAIPHVSFSSTTMTFESENTDSELEFLFQRMIKDLKPSRTSPSSCKSCDNCQCQK